MKLPNILAPNTEKLKSGDVVAIIGGRGAGSGIVIEASKRKTKVHHVNNSVEWIENKYIRKVKDETWVHRIRREIKNNNEDPIDESTQ